MASMLNVASVSEVSVASVNTVDTAVACLSVGLCVPMKLLESSLFYARLCCLFYC